MLTTTDDDDARMPARLLYYKLTLLAFGSGELKQTLHSTHGFHGVTGCFTHKPVPPGTVCVKKYFFSNGTFTPEECHMFYKIDFNDFFIEIIYFFMSFQ